MNISILGCGWLGLPAARQLNENHHIRGSTTSEDKLSLLNEEGIEPYLVRLEPDLQCEECDEFWESDVLLLNIPPGRGRNNVVDFHKTQVKSVIGRVENSPIEFVIYASSTSVYPNLGGVMTEEDASPGTAGRASGEALLKAEALLRNSRSFDTTILRFGGLYGYDRHPARYLAGKTDLPNGNAPVNLIHRDDSIRIIQTIITRDIRGETFNAVSDGHPPKSQYYKAIAREAGLEPPEFLPDSETGYKVVSNRKLKKRLQYRFAYPNPMDAVSSTPS